MENHSLSRQSLDTYIRLRHSLSRTWGARFYDPQIGWWHSVDPMANTYPTLSPYHFGGNNPIRNIDIGGMAFVGAYGLWDETSSGKLKIYDPTGYANSARVSANQPNAVVRINNTLINPLGQYIRPMQNPTSNTNTNPTSGNEPTNDNASGGGDNINNPLAPYTSWIGVIGEAADQTLKEIPLSGNPIKIIAKGGKTIGWTGEAISIGVSLRNVIVNPSFSNVSRLQASIGIATLNLIPEGGTLASFFATGIESQGGFDGFYNLMDKYENWYHDNNLKLGNIYIPNSLLNPSGTPKFSINLY